MPTKPLSATAKKRKAYYYYAGKETKAQSVTKKKFKSLQKAADEFLFQNPHYRHVQFDILSITLDAEAGPEFFLIEDVFL